MKALRLRPKAPYQIRDPQTQEYLPQAGGTVELSPYWLRRLDEGSVEILEEIFVQPLEEGMKSPFKESKKNKNQEPLL